MTEELLEQIIEIINPREKVTSDRIRNLNGRLHDKYTPDEILAAAIEFSKSQWHKDNGQMSVDNLIRPSKFGRWFAAAQKNIQPTASTQDDMVRQRMQDVS